MDSNEQPIENKDLYKAIQDLTNEVRTIRQFLIRPIPKQQAIVKKKFKRYLFIDGYLVGTNKNHGMAQKEVLAADLILMELEKPIAELIVDHNAAKGFKYKLRKIEDKEDSYVPAQVNFGYDTLGRLVDEVLDTMSPRYSWLYKEKAVEYMKQ